MVRKFKVEGNNLEISSILINFFIHLKDLNWNVGKNSFETFLSQSIMKAWGYDFFLDVYLYKCGIIKITKLLLILYSVKESKKV